LWFDIHMAKPNYPFLKKHIFNGLFIVFLLLIIFVPPAKALMMQGLMEIGLFKPALEDKKPTAPLDLSQVKFKDVNGKLINLADLKGKVVFLNFWATWCPPCLAEMPSVNKLYEQFKTADDVVFILVDADGDFAKSQAYFDRKKYQMPIYAFASTLPEAIFNRALPTTLVFDKQGRVSFKAEGAANYADRKFISFMKDLQALKN